MVIQWNWTKLWNCFNFVYYNIKNYIITINYKTTKIHEKDNRIARKNAGNTIVGEDAIRSIAAAIFSLGAEEVLVIGHTECGMAGSDPDKLRNAMIERGIPQEEIDKVDLKSWIGGFEDEEENVIDTVEKIRNHPLIPDVPIHGLMMDIVTGKLDVVVDDR